MSFEDCYTCSRDEDDTLNEDYQLLKKKEEVVVHRCVVCFEGLDDEPTVFVNSSVRNFLYYRMFSVGFQ